MGVGVSPAEIPQDRMNAGQIAKLLGCKQQNVHLWIRRRGIEPVSVEKHPIGKLYDRKTIEAAALQFLSKGGSPGGRAADARRRDAALVGQFLRPR